MRYTNPCFLALLYYGSRNWEGLPKPEIYSGSMTPSPLQVTLSKLLTSVCWGQLSLLPSAGRKIRSSLLTVGYGLRSEGLVGVTGMSASCTAGNFNWWWSVAPNCLFSRTREKEPTTSSDPVRLHWFNTYSDSVLWQ